MCAGSRLLCCINETTTGSLGTDDWYIVSPTYLVIKEWAYISVKVNRSYSKVYLTRMAKLNSDTSLWTILQIYLNAFNIKNVFRYILPGVFVILSQLLQFNIQYLVICVFRFLFRWLWEDLHLTLVSVWNRKYKNYPSLVLDHICIPSRF